MFRIMIALASFVLLTASTADAARYHRVRPAWRTKPASVRVRVAPPARMKVVVKRPARPGAGYVWRDSEWVWRTGGWHWVPAAWIRPPAAGLVWVPGSRRSSVWISGYWR